MKRLKNDETRNIPMSGVLKEALKSVEYSPSSEYVFSYKGKKIGSFKTAFNGALRRAGVKPFRFHDLRHTFASNLVMAGVDLPTVQELLGHKNINMTKRYSHPTPEHKIKAVESIAIDTYLDTSGKSESAKTDVTNRNH